MSADLLPFPQLLFPRLRGALNRLALGVWRDPVALTVSRTESRTAEFPYPQARRAGLRPMALPCAWKAPGFSTTWFRVRPPAGHQPRVGEYFHWDDNAEATAWLEGEPVFGFDATHRHWPWPKGAREIWIESIFCQSGIWHAAAKGIGPVGSILSQARLVRKDEAAWHAYFDLEVLTDWLEEEVRRALPHAAEMLVGGFRTWPEIDKAGASFLPDGVGTGEPNRFRPELERLPALLRRVFLLLDEAVSEFHQRGPTALRLQLADIYALLRDSAPQHRAILTGHAHIDLVWLWPERTGEQKAVRTFASVSHLLKDYPEFHFGYTQPASYAAVKQRAPGLMKRVSNQIRQGRWEPVGAMYVESDTLLSCGESLLRSLTVGQAEFVKLQGAPSPVLWLPDVFGLCGCLPNVMKLAGVSGFYTCKMAWNVLHRFPHTSFVWRGTDGSEVLAHFSLAAAYNNPARPRNLRLESDAQRQAAVHGEFLLPSGWGDGGGGPTADIVERTRRQTNLRNQPSVSWGRIDDFFRRMEKVRGRLPVWRGEIYLEGHRGTYTTHCEMKEAYRRLERALQAWEAARCVGGGGPIPIRPWQRLIFAQFHDLLPGSSMQEVYDAIVPELVGLEREALAEAERSLGSPRRKRPGLFNPLPLSLPVWQSGFAAVLPALGHVASEGLQKQERAAKAALRLSNDVLTNGQVEARFDRKGNLLELSVDGDGSLAGTPQLVAYRDIPFDFEAWELDRQTLDAGRPLDLKQSGKMRSGPGWKGIRQLWATPGGSTVELLWRLRSGFAALEVEFKVDWREKEMLLRFEVPTVFRGQTALFGSPFGGEWRVQQPGDSRASAQWEAPASRWVLASDDGRQEGAFLLSEAKYGFSARDGTLGVSLLRSAKITLTNAFPPAFRAGPAPATFSDLGKHQIRLALGRLTADAARESYPAALAETIFATPISTESGPAIVEDLFPLLEGMPSLIPSWAAPIGRDRWILRLHETMGRRGEVLVKPRPGWAVRILAKAFPGPGDKPRPSDSGDRLAVGPFAILGLELSRGRIGAP